MSPSHPRLIVRRGPDPDQIFRLSGPMSIVGREPVNEVVISDPEVSRRHARIFLEEEAYYIEDLHSTNGTYVNGRRIVERTRLASGDIVDFGETVRVIFDHEISPSFNVKSAGSALNALGEYENEEAFITTLSPIPGDRATSRPMRPTVLHKSSEAEDQAAGSLAAPARPAGLKMGDEPRLSSSRRWFILLAIGFFLIVAISCLGFLLFLNGNYPVFFSG